MSFTMVCLVHLLIYSIIIIGIDRYLRIKRCVNFKKIWTTKVVVTLLSLACFLALFQRIITTIGLVLKKLEIVVPIYVGIDILILSVIIFLEAVAQRCSVKKLFLEISQNSQENTCARVSF